MKSFKLQLMLLVAMLMATSSAFADVQVTANPADNSVVESLSKITITFPGEIQCDVLNVGVYLKDERGRTVNKVAEIDGNKLILTCVPAVTTLGNYTVTIDPGTLKMFDSDSWEYNPIEQEIVLHYTVNRPAFPGVADPADSSEVESLSKITLTFPGHSKAGFNENMQSATTITNSKGDSAATTTSFSKGTLDNQVVLECTPAVTKVGDYTVTIPAGTLVLDDTTYNHLIVLHYKVRAILQVVAVPADSSVVRSLDKIGIRFPQVGTIFVGEQINYGWNNASTVTNDATGESAVTETELSYDEEDKSIILLELTPAVTTPGNYTVTIPAGCLYFYNDVFGYTYKKPIVLHYTVVGPNGSVVMVPADSSIVDSLKTFTLTFSDKKTVFITKDKQPTLHIFMGGDSIVKLDCSKSRARMVSSVIPKRDNKITMILPTAVTAPGIYMLQIPDSAFCFEDSIQGEYSTAMTFYYMVEPPVQMVADPADSSVVQSLSEIKITLTSPEYDYADFADYNLQREIDIINDETEESAVESIGFSNDENNEFLLILNMNPAITTPGKYTMYIPSGAFLLGKRQLDKDLIERYHKTIVLHYTVSQSTGISDVKVEGNLKGIRVNLNGQRVGDDYQGVVIENGVKKIMK